MFTAFLISQLKGSACDPLVYFTRSKISRLFVLVCSRKKKRGRKKRKKHPNMYRSTWLMSILQLLASLWCTAGSAAWARLLRKRNLTDRKRHETHYACRQTTNARQQPLSLLSLSCFHLFLRVANYTQAHSHEDRINIITRGSALLQKGRLVTV